MGIISSAERAMESLNERSLQIGHKRERGSVYEVPGEDNLRNGREYIVVTKKAHKAENS